MDGDADRPEHTAEQKKELLLQFTERDLTTALNAIKAAFDASMEDDDDEDDPGHAPEPKHGRGASLPQCWSLPVK